MSLSGLPSSYLSLSCPSSSSQAFVSFTGPPTKDLHCSLAQTQDVTSPNLSLSGSPSPHQALPASLTIIPSQTGPSFPSQSPYFPFLSFSGAQSPFQALPPFHNPHFPWPCQYYLSISSLPLPTRSLSALFLPLKPSSLSGPTPIKLSLSPSSQDLYGSPSHVGLFRHSLSIPRPSLSFTLS